MLLEVLKENFEQIFVCDAEFICDKKDKGERPNVVCFVFKEIICLISSHANIAAKVLSSLIFISCFFNSSLTTSSALRKFMAKFA